jgi:heptosyltransferase III
MSLPKTGTPRNVLLVRTDRIGDVVLSLPAASYIKDAYPGCRVTFLAQEYTAPLIQLSPDVDQVICDDGRSPFELAAKLKSKKFDAAIALHPTARLALALRLAGIPARVGTAYRSYSLLFNRRVRQHRKFSLKHEAEHNLDLVERGLSAAPPGKQYLPKLEITAELLDRTREKLSPVLDIGQPFVAVHPGSGGSARDWPLKNFAELINKIQGAEGGNQKAAVTLGPGEDHIKEKLLGLLKTEPAWVSGLSLPELASFLSRAKVLVANSTGPLHIAAAAGTRVVGLYCPVIPCHPRRWGPYGPGHEAIIPPVGSCKECSGKNCSDYDCMEKITVQEVFDKVMEMSGKNNR